MYNITFEMNIWILNLCDYSQNILNFILMEMFLFKISNQEKNINISINLILLCNFLQFKYKI